MPVERRRVGADADRVLVHVSLTADPFDDRGVTAGVEQHQVDRQDRPEQILDPVPDGDLRHDVDRLADRAGAGEHERRDLVGRDELTRRHSVGRLVIGVTPAGTSSAAYRPASLMPSVAEDRPSAPTPTNPWSAVNECPGPSGAVPVSSVPRGITSSRQPRSSANSIVRPMTTSPDVVRMRNVVHIAIDPSLVVVTAHGVGLRAAI